MCVPASTVVVFWTVLFPYLSKFPVNLKFLLNFASYNQHGVCGVLALAELLVSNIPLPLHMFGWVGLWSTMYGFSQFIFNAYTGYWLYPFLDTSSIVSVYAVPALYVFHLACFYLVQWLASVRDRTRQKAA